MDTEEKQTSHLSIDIDTSLVALDVPTKLGPVLGVKLTPTWKLDSKGNLKVTITASKPGSVVYAYQVLHNYAKTTDYTLADFNSANDISVIPKVATFKKDHIIPGLIQGQKLKIGVCIRYEGSGGATSSEVGNTPLTLLS